MLSIFVYLCEAYLGIPSDLELFQYFYGMARQTGIAGSCGLKLHDGKSKEYIQMFTRFSWPGWRKRWFYGKTTQDDSLTFAGKAAEKIPSWDSTPRDLGRIAPYIQAIKDLKEEGLTVRTRDI
uniref:Putative retrotransposon protein n=1 Tax=Phyllostachys edulis TaxID=38705 RepID=D3IVG8_PHYED|nr:putative retrotransposon protein [Phyllostachys edulis]